MVEEGGVVVLGFVHGNEKKKRQIRREEEVKSYCEVLKSTNVGEEVQARVEAPKWENKQSI